MMSLSDLNADAQSRRVQLTQYLSATNPPSWVSFTSTGSGFQVVLSPPVTNSGAAYLSQGAGLDFPSTSNNSQTLGAPPIFFYQVQLATDAAFTQNLQLFDMGTSPTMTVSATGAQFAQARARFANSPYSQWVPFSGSSTAGPTYRPFEFTTTGSVVNPFKGMDGDTTSFAVVAATPSASASVIYGPFYGPTTLTNGLTLSVNTAAPLNSGTITISYSVDAGGSYTTLRTSGGTWTQVTDTATLPNNFSLGLVRVQTVLTTAPTNSTLDFYETYIQ